MGKILVSMWFIGLMVVLTIGFLQSIVRGG